MIQGLESRNLDVQEFIDGRPLSRLQWLVLLLCFLVIAADGFDTIAVGMVAPALSEHWGIASSALGPVMSAALVGLGIGALIAGPAADRLGRRPVILLSVMWFGLWSLGSSFAADVSELTLLRFLTGLGLGSALPNALTLVSEYAPSRLRARLVSAAFCGFPFGLIVGAFAAPWLIPAFGWKSIFMVGGVVPLLLLGPLLFWLPESVKLMVARKYPPAAATALLQRMAPGEDFSGRRCVVDEAHSVENGVGVGQLLKSRFLRGTLLLWAVYFMGLVVFYFQTSWLPVLLKEAGFNEQSRGLMTSLYPFGGIFGILCAGWIIDRFTPILSTATMFFIAALLAILVYGSFGNSFVLCILIFLSGMTVSGAVAAMSPLAATFYPTQIRATGIAWMFGVGRIGGVAGAFTGATLIGWGWGFDAIFAMLALPSAIAAFALVLLAQVTRETAAKEVAEVEESKNRTTS